VFFFGFLARADLSQHWTRETSALDGHGSKAVVNSVVQRPAQDPTTSRNKPVPRSRGVPRPVSEAKCTDSRTRTAVRHGVTEITSTFTTTIPHANATVVHRRNAGH